MSSAGYDIANHLHQATGEATYTQPPNSSAFDHIRKRRRAQPPQATAQTPSIHVHFPTPVPQPHVSIVPVESSPSPGSKPATVTTPTPAEAPTSPPQPIIDLTNDHDATIYPTIGELLGELDEIMPSLGFPRYEERLTSAGFTHAHQVADTPGVRQTFDRLGIPVGIRQEIFEHAARMTRRAEKSKQVTKTEDTPI
jgi:hypothetical protein